MTSLLTSIKQNDTDGGYFITVGSIAGTVATAGAVYSYNAASNSFSTSAFASGGALSTSIATAGALLKDMGKTVVSSARTFRKIQLVLNNSPSTFGVGGPQGVSLQDYLTGYIELGFEGTGTPAKVAKFGK